jgi:hypothetical protein
MRTLESATLGDALRAMGSITSAALRLVPPVVRDDLPGPELEVVDDDRG